MRPAAHSFRYEGAEPFGGLTIAEHRAAQQTRPGGFRRIAIATLAVEAFAAVRAVQFYATGAGRRPAPWHSKREPRRDRHRPGL